MIIKKIKNQKTSKPTARQIADLVDYIRSPHNVNPEEKLEYAGSRNFLSQTHNGQKVSMISLAQESAHSRMPVAHWLISWQENEQPTHEQIEQCVDIFLEGMQLSGHQAIFGVHKNTENIHLHIAVNRMNEETMKVVKPHKGFDIEAAHRILAKIEAIQGWEPLKNARYVMLEDGQVVRRKKENSIQKPTQKALDFEHARGEKSAQRIAQEKAKDILEKAQTWQELHTGLEKLGMRFALRGAGSVIFVGDIAVKSSSVNRKFSIKNLTKRLGEFSPYDYPPQTAPKIIEPVSSVNSEEWEAYQAEQKKIDDGEQKKLEIKEEKELPPLALKSELNLLEETGGWWILSQENMPQNVHLEAHNRVEKAHGKRTYFNPQKPYIGHIRKLSEHSLCRLSECSLALRGQKQQEPTSGFLPRHARIDRRASTGMRWSNDAAKGTNLRLEKFTHRISRKRKKLPRFKDWLIQNGMPKKADLWRHRFSFQDQPQEEYENSSCVTPEKIMGKEADIFRKYAHAVAADSYRVTCIKMLRNGEKKTFILDKKDGVTKGFSKEELLLRIPEILRIQARGENIYYTPLSQNRHHILIDDMSVETVNRFRANGFMPAALLLSSPGNFQCVITIPKLGTEFDRQVGNRLAELLNREYGDPKLSGCIHPHRAPGFRNLKPKHRQADGTYPEVRLLQAIRQDCPKTLALAQKIAAEIEKEALRQKKLAAQQPVLSSRPGSSIAAYQAHLANIRNHLTIEDNSRVDSMIALRMRATGHSQEDIAHAIEQCAPAMRGKSEGRNWHQYAERTAAYAYSVAGDRDLSKHANYIEHWKKIEGIEPDNSQKRHRLR